MRASGMGCPCQVRCRGLEDLAVCAAGLIHLGRGLGSFQRSELRLNTGFALLELLTTD